MENIWDQSCDCDNQDCRQLMMSVARQTNLTARHLGRHLALPEYEILNIESDYRGNLVEQRYQVFLKWIALKGCSATNLALFQAFDRAGDTNMVQLIKNELTPPQPVALVRDVPQDMLSSITPIKSPAEYKTLPPDLNTPSRNHSGMQTTLSNNSLLAAMYEGIRSPSSPPSPAVRQDVCSTTVGLVSSSGGVSTVDGEEIARCVRPSTLPLKSDGVLKNLEDKIATITEQFYYKVNCTELQNNVLSQKVKELEHERDFFNGALVRKTTELDRMTVLSHKQNATNRQLTMELELHKEMFKVVCGVLEEWRGEVGEEISPLHEQIEAMKRAVSSPDSNTALLTLTADVKQLQKDKEQLVRDLDKFISLYSQKHQALEAMSAEHQEQEVELLTLRKEVTDAWWEVDQWKKRTQELEDKVRDLEEKNEMLRKNSLRPIVVTPSRAPMQFIKRSHSEGAYIVSQTSPPPQKQLSLDPAIVSKLTNKHEIKETEDCGLTMTTGASYHPEQGCTERSPPVKYSEQESIVEQWRVNVDEIVVQYASRRDVLTAGAKQIRERMAHFNSNQ